MNYAARPIRITPTSTANTNLHPLASQSLRSELPPPLCTYMLCSVHNCAVVETHITSSAGSADELSANHLERMRIRETKMGRFII
jgi:hypothetical protein